MTIPALAALVAWLRKEAANQSGIKLLRPASVKLSASADALERQQAVVEAVREGRRLIGFMTNTKIAEGCRLIDAALDAPPEGDG